MSFGIRRTFGIAVVVFVAIASPEITGAADKNDVVQTAGPGVTVPKPLNPQGTVLLDRHRGRVLLKTKVVAKDVVLEMLLCPKKTKEHESILAVDAKAYTVHAALLALGAKSGTPVSFDPEFAPPTGDKVNIFVNWTDEAGKQHRRPAQEWVRTTVHRYYEYKMPVLPEGLKLPPKEELRYDKYGKVLLWFGPMTAKKRDQLLKLNADTEFQKAIHQFHKQSQSRPLHADFVFAGSGFYTDEESGKQMYRGEGGDLICVANFPTATIDIAILSSAQGDPTFEAWAERIPEIGTDVLLELIPEPRNADAAALKAH